MEEAMDSRRSELPLRYRVFYPLRRGVLVTDMWFCAQAHRLSVREIGTVGWCQSTGRLTRRVARLIIVVDFALVIIVAVFAMAVVGSSLLALTLAAAHLSVVVLGTWFAAYRHPGPLQLWAEYLGGGQMLLFSSTDHTEFHKVRRALERAIEYNRELAA
jgi:hypothetical protein